MMRTAVSLAIVVQLAPRVAAGVPEASELLDKFSENRDRVKSYIVKFEYSQEGMNPRQDISPRILMKRTVEIRTDGQRHYSRWTDWTTNMKGLNSLKEAVGTGKFAMVIHDGNNMYRYTRHPDGYTKIPHRLLIDPDKGILSGNDCDNRGMKFRFVRGLMGSDWERVDSILRGADRISVRTQTERIGGSDCYVLEGDTKHGRYVLWIDPNHGYNIAKAEVIKEAGDIFAGGHALRQGRRIITSVMVSDFLEVGGEWTAKGYHSERTDCLLPKNWQDTDTVDYKLNEFKPNPDHDALNSLGTGDILNGSSVRIMGIDGIRYIWQDGKVVDSYGHEVDIETLRPPSLKGKALPEK
ncbi:MAG: hypothetical protein JSU70_11400 [Phycisphaerales bacterium]|nr:MAG: hypothetical protein JSU70_11400 [Phycisphaerales bacterium]